MRTTTITLPDSAERGSHGARAPERTATLDRDDPDELVPNHWYAIAESRKVRRKPLALTRFGIRLVLWRAREGLVCMPDRCPHRGAALSQGTVRGGCLACPYHGFEYDSRGRCVLVPANGRGAPVPPTLALRAFTVRERNGFVWMWWGDARDALPSLPWFESLPDRLDRSSTLVFEWRVNFNRVMESMFDIHHMPFVHRRISGRLGRLLDPYVAEIEGDLIRTRGNLRNDDGRTPEESPGVPFEVSVAFPGTTLWRTPRTRGFWLLAVAAPIDRASTWICFRYYQEYVRLPIAGRLAAWLSATFERLFLHPDDERVFRSLRTGVGANRDHHIHADRGMWLWQQRRRESLATAEAARDGARSAISGDAP